MNKARHRVGNTNKESNNVSGYSSKRNNSRKIIKKQINIRNIVLIIAILVFIYCSYKLIDWFINNKHSKDVTTDVLESVEITDTQGDVIEKINEPNEENLNANYVNDYYYYMSLPFMSVDFTALNEKNTDTVAWLKVPRNKC